jgi:hypothetical protein
MDGAAAADLSSGALPTPAINHPADGEVRAAGTSIPFVGHATDPQDGVLTGSQLVWQSNLTGMIGTGEMLNAAMTQGIHTITLTATDTSNRSASVSITLNVTP